MSLNLSNVTTRSKFRFDNYYRRFYVSRNRGFDFEGMIAGFLDGNISESKSSPFDVATKGNNISLKTLNNETESVVVKSISTSLKTYYNEYNGSPENKEELLKIFNSENPIKELVNSENNDMVNIAEDVVRLSLEGIDSLLIGIPKENNRVDLYYFTKERLVYLSTLKGVIMAPKNKGSKQLRLSSSILPEADICWSTFIRAVLNVKPSNVKLCSPWNASVPVAVNTLLLAPFDMKSETSTEIASAATSIPVPAPTAKADPPPPVKPLPATPAAKASASTPPSLILIVLAMF